MDKRKKWTITVAALAAVLVCLLTALLVISVRNAYDLRIALTGGEHITLEYGTVYEEPGVAAWVRGKDLPAEGKDLTARITVEGTVDTSRTGTYILTYTVRYTENDQDLTATAQRTVTVVDTQAPVITLVTDPDAFTYPGQEYVEEGFTATDDYDGDLTHLVERTVENGVVTYRVKDSAGNEAVIQRTIHYDDPAAPVITLAGDNPVWLQGGADVRGTRIHRL